jgi:hypothetical protein
MLSADVVQRYFFEITVGYNVLQGILIQFGEKRFGGGLEYVF